MILIENNEPYIRENYAVNTVGLATNYPMAINNTITYQVPVTTPTGNVTLTVAQSGGTFLFNSASGYTFTLPTATPGLTYQFVVTTSVTSNSDKVLTTGSAYFVGGLTVQGGSSATVFFGNGTSHIDISQNGSTTGGLIGSIFTVTCLTAGVWTVEGQFNGSGTQATPFATS